MINNANGDYFAVDAKTFIQKIAEITENKAGKLSLDMSLGDVNGWDSLGAVTFLAMADTEFHISLRPGVLRNAKTVRDLYNLACQGDKKRLGNCEHEISAIWCRN